MTKLETSRRAVIAFALGVLSGCASLDSSKLSALQTNVVSVGVSPAGQGSSALEQVLAAIDSAQRSIHVAAYSFTSDAIVQRLASAKQRGVKVRIVADRAGNQGSRSVLSLASAAGIPVRTNAHYAIMHNKFMVVDGDTVETGSFNYTGSAATRNAENALVVRNAKELAQQYESEWQRLWEEGQDFH